MGENKRLKFDSNKFSKDEFTPDERGEMRERNFHYDGNFLSAEDFIRASGIGWIVNLSKGVPAFTKVFIFVSAIGGAILVAKQNGWL